MEMEEGSGDGAGGSCIAHMIDTGTVESHRYHLARRTVFEMLHDRGYAVSPTDATLSLPDFRDRFGDHPNPDLLNISTFLFADPAIKIQVIFCGTEKVNLSTIRNISLQVSKEGIPARLMLVLESQLTAKARDALKENFKFPVETFQITELLVNITKHTLKPRHDILNEEEKQKLLKKYSVTEGQLPRMLETDAIARYYGLVRGQVLKITYDGELTGSQVSFRCVM